MRQPCLRAATLAFLLLLLLAPGAQADEKKAGPPPTRRDDVRDVVHGVEIVDPYRWLEDGASPETRAWIAAQDRYARSVLEPLPVRSDVEKRLSELLKIDQVSAPFERGGSYFFSKRAAGQALSVLYRRRGLDGPDEVILDPHGLSPDQTTSVGFRDVSTDGRLMAYAVREGGLDEVELRLMDLATKRDLPDRLPKGLYAALSFSGDGKGFYYGRRSRETGTRILYHAIGTDPAKDVEVFGAGYGPATWIGSEVSDDGRWLLISVGHGWARDEVWVQDLANGGLPRPIVTDLEAHFNAGIAGDRLILHTDWQAPTYRLLSVDLKDPARERWREIVPAGRDVLDGFALIGGKLLVSSLHDVTSRISVFSLDGAPQGEVELPGLGSAGISGRWNSPEAFLSFTSWTTPSSTFRYDVRTGERRLWAKSEVPVDPTAFEVKQVWYTSKDGTRVPMFLVHKKGLAPDGARPTLLYGYGGFNVSLTPAFRAAAVLWAERGGVFAIANLRGGSEFGETWHRAGMLEKKQNVLDDFIAAGEWLVANRWTTPDRLAIQGGSNGGLLVGAALTQRPDLFRAVLCQFPDLDMIRYPLWTESNNPPALLEYGDARDSKQFEFLRAYSPYQKVAAGTRYPAVLLTSGDADTRVPPQQARKMAARLQAATISGQPVLLLYDAKAGHSGGKPFDKVVADMALELSFLLWQLGER